MIHKQWKRWCDGPRAFREGQAARYEELVEWLGHYFPEVLHGWRETQRRREVVGKLVEELTMGGAASGQEEFCLPQ